MAGSKIKRYIIGLLLIICGCISITVHASSEITDNGIDKLLPAQPAQQFMNFRVSKVIYKHDDNLVRLCGYLTGIPNTSARIDGITLSASGKKVDANDIDGIDFQRYFIWEEDGAIYLEIDFPGYKLSRRIINSPKGCQIIFHTAKGDITIPYQK